MRLCVDPFRSVCVCKYLDVRLHACLRVLGKSSIDSPGPFSSLLKVITGDCREDRGAASADLY